MNLKSLDYLLQQIKNFNILNGCKMEILFASGFDRNKELMEKLILLVKEQ